MKKIFETFEKAQKCAQKIKRGGVFPVPVPEENGTWSIKLSAMGGKRSYLSEQGYLDATRGAGDAVREWGQDG